MPLIRQAVADLAEPGSLEGVGPLRIVSPDIREGRFHQRPAALGAECLADHPDAVMGPLRFGDRDSDACQDNLLEMPEKFVH